MSEQTVSFEEGASSLLACSAYIAERLKSADGRADAMAQIVPLYLAGGNVDLAAALADSVEDTITRDRLLTAVADRCAEAGDDDYAFQLAEAVEDVSLQAQARERIALRKTGRGLTEEAVEIAATLDHPDSVLIAVAEHKYGGGDREDAVAMAEGFEHPVSRAEAFRHFAALEIQQGDKARAAELLDRAADEAPGIDFQIDRLRTLLEIANGFIDASRNDRAVAVLDLARREAEAVASVQRDALLAAVSIGFFRAGSIEFADRTLDLVGDKTAMITALTGFAVIYRRKGEAADALEAVDEALAIIRSQTEKETRDHPAKFAQWRSLAIEAAAAGDSERGLEVAREIPDGDSRDEAFKRLAVLFADDGREEFAEQALGQVVDPLQRAYALISVADVCSERGDGPGAASRLDSAVALLPAVERPVAQAAVLTECAKRRFAAGEDVTGRGLGLECCRVIGGIMDASLRAMSLAALAGVYEANGLSVSDEESETLKGMMSKL